MAADVAEVDEVTVPTSLARAFVELATTCVREISDGAVFGRHDTPGVVASGHGLQTSLGLLFLVILDVDVAEHVITQILYCVQLLNLTKLLELFQQFLKELLEMFLGVSGGLPGGGIRRRRDVQVGDHQCLREVRPQVVPRAAVAMTASANLEVERTIDLVFFCAEHPG